MGWVLAAVFYALGGVMSHTAFDGIGLDEWYLIAAWPLVALVQGFLGLLEMLA
jgi:hypothetical protein